jgi:phenylalanyl-tRNA synthetase beta chain
MKFSESWLRTLVDHEAVERGTFPSADHGRPRSRRNWMPVAPQFNDVVVAQVLEVVKHPDADRLNVCQGRYRHAATPQRPSSAARRMSPSACACRAPCPVPELPGDFKLSRSPRCAASSPRACSARPKNSVLPKRRQVLLILPADAPVGQSIRQYLDLDDNVV